LSVPSEALGLRMPQPVQNVLSFSDIQALAALADCGLAEPGDLAIMNESPCSCAAHKKML